CSLVALRACACVHVCAVTCRCEELQPSVGDALRSGQSFGSTSLPASLASLSASSGLSLLAATYEPVMGLDEAWASDHNAPGGIVVARHTYGERGQPHSAAALALAGAVEGGASFPYELAPKEGAPRAAVLVIHHAPPLPPAAMRRRHPPTWSPCCLPPL